MYGTDIMKCYGSCVCQCIACQTALPRHLCGFMQVIGHADQCLSVDILKVSLTQSMCALLTKVVALRCFIDKAAGATGDNS